MVRQSVQNVSAFSRRRMTMTCLGLRKRPTMPVIVRVTIAQKELSPGTISRCVASRRLLKLRPWKEGDDIIVAEL